MLLARIGLAAAEAGAGPAGMSLLTEIFPKERRTTVISVMLAANAVGLSGGLALAGWLSHWYGWRAVFLIVGLPGIRSDTRRVGKGWGRTGRSRWGPDPQK